MRRREFIALFGGAAVLVPSLARAQQGERVRRVGMLTGAAGQDDDDMPARSAAFLQALQEASWVEGRNVQIVSRFPRGNPEACARPSRS